MTPGKKFKMLLVDDEHQILDSLTQLFDEDYIVLQASSGQKAISLISSHPDISIVMSDQRMPGIKGIEVLRKAKELIPDAIRILLTGYSDLESIMDSVNVGEVFKYVRKPWSSDALRSIVGLSMSTYQLRINKKNAARKTTQPEPKDHKGRLSVEKTTQPEPKTDHNGKLFDEFIKEATSQIAHIVENKVNQNNQTQRAYEQLLKARPSDYMLAQYRKSEDEFFAKLNEKNLMRNEMLSLFEQYFYSKNGKPKILIVDDEAFTLLSLTELLAAKYEVLVCHSADMALEILKRDAFIAVVITDQRMPKKSGREFLMETQSLVPLVPKILMTGYVDVEDIISLINQGQLHRYIQKPWNTEKLIETLSEAVAECKKRVEANIFDARQM